jgi:hypothetical protein
MTGFIHYNKRRILMIWKKSRRTKATKKWLEDTDPIRLITYYILLHVKYLVIALVVYIFVLTISDILFTFEYTGGVAKGSHYWEQQNPKLNV